MRFLLVVASLLLLALMANVKDCDASLSPSKEAAAADPKGIKVYI